MVASEASDRIDVPRAGSETVGDLLEHLVAHRVPERIVDLLEVVEIEHHDGESLAVSTSRRCGLRNSVLKQHVIRKAGQGVDKSGTPNLLDEARIVERRGAHRSQRVQESKCLWVEGKSIRRL